MNFFNQVYEIVKQIPKGKVASYGTVARLAGNSRMARQVGWALHVNPDQSNIPCHRVVSKDGACSKAFAFGGLQIQKEILLSEGVGFIGDNVDMANFSIQYEITSAIDDDKKS